MKNSKNIISVKSDVERFPFWAKFTVKAANRPDMSSEQKMMAKCRVYCTAQN